MAAEAQPAAAATGSHIRPGTRTKIIEILSDNANGCLQELGYFPALHDKFKQAEALNGHLQEELVRARSESAQRTRGDVYKQQFQMASATAERYQTENVKMWQDNSKLIADNEGLRSEVVAAQTRASVFEQGCSADARKILEEYANLQVNYANAVKQLESQQKQLELQQKQLKQFLDASNRARQQAQTQQQQNRPAGPSTQPMRRSSAPQALVNSPQFAPQAGAPTYAMMPMAHPQPQPYPPIPSQQPPQQYTHSYPHPQQPPQPHPVGFQPPRQMQSRPPSSSAAPVTVAIPSPVSSGARQVPSPVLINGPPLGYRPMGSVGRGGAPPLMHSLHFAQQQRQQGQTPPMTSLHLPLQAFPAHGTSPVVASHVPASSSPLTTRPPMQFPPMQMQQLPPGQQPPHRVLPPLQVSQYSPPVPAGSLLVPSRPAEGPVQVPPPTVVEGAEQEQVQSPQLPQETDMDTEMQDVEVLPIKRENSPPPVLDSAASPPPPPRDADPATPPEAHEAITPPPTTTAPPAVVEPESLKRVSPDVDNGDSRKRMRMSESEEAVKEPVVKMEEMNPTPPAGSDEDEDDLDDDEEEGDDDDDESGLGFIEVGPDGLRTVKDCLSAIFPRDNGFVCMFCAARYKDDLEKGEESEAPMGMGDSTMEEQEAHCLAEHDHAWELLRSNT
ncbi:hypothetical protein FB45DRAFT_420879 [Roridomyces roridus]|uniref:Uncharacterized protein n=1 Tax=Roridomyces roridus TaxID=1738132 RepID=A0AAD7C552_9AGAR|nr:hypothetical protein FB45DRAFT_420879 [Roridomyces roridus]